MAKISLIIALILVSIIVYVRFFIHSNSIDKNPKPETAENQMGKLPKLKQIAKPNPTETFRVPILLYHYVENVTDARDTIRKSLNVPPFIFEEQLDTLKKAGYTFITVAELGEVLDGKKELPKNPIILTFDDGHWDLATDIVPILKKFDIKATAYVCPGLIGGSDYLSKEQLVEVINSGVVEVGAHTVHHQYLKGRQTAFVEKEIVESKTQLEQNYNIKVVSFAYPYGAFDDQAIKLTRDAGFSTAVSTLPGISQGESSRFYLYRLRPGQRSGKALVTWLEQNSFKAY